MIVAHWSIILIGLVVAIFFHQFLLGGLLPLPADTIVGMYHPWRDVVWDNFTAGVPFKNFLITDPVRQQYPWRELGIDLISQGQLPLWNPYTLAGGPLLANLQGAVFYPLNILFFVLPFNLAWSGLIFLQPLLAGFFLYAYLRQLKLEKLAAFLGAISFSLSGFFIAWLEWGTVLQVALWMPLILLAIDKIVLSIKSQVLSKSGNLLLWGLVFVFSLTVSFLAGHLQTSFYLVLFSIIYLVWRLLQTKKDRRKLILLFCFLYSLFLLLTSIQWLPTLQFIKLSAREIDQSQFNQPGWFIPWQNLVQFLAPDFFGNPTTLNYWGIFNYAEFLGYLGVIPLIFAFLAIIWRRDKTTLFFSFLVFLFLSFALPTPWAKLPYWLNLPLISTSQPTRLLFIVDFCLAVLAALGVDAFLKKKISWGKIILTLIPFSIFYGLLWLFVLGAKKIWPEAPWVVNLAVSQRNLILPTAIFAGLAGLMVASWLTPKLFKKKRFIIRYSRLLILIGIVLLTIFDLLRFGWKFTPFVKEEWLFPSTETVEFLKKDQDVFRLMTTDRRLLAPNFSIPYRLQTIEGYDPLYLSRYAELIAASERGEANIEPPFGFNRIITPHNYESRIIDLLNTKYLLSLDEEDSPKWVKVFEEGQTKVYQNQNVFPRAFIVYQYQLAKDKQEAIDLLMNEGIDLRETVILESDQPETGLVKGENKVAILDYEENKVLIEVETSQSGILVLTDSFYPGWQAKIDGQGTQIYRADYNFRGVIVPEGNHQVTFEYGWY